MSYTAQCKGCGNGYVKSENDNGFCLNCLIEKEWKEHPKMDEDEIESFVRNKYHIP